MSFTIEMSRVEVKFLNSVRDVYKFSGTCFNGKEIFKMKLEPSISTNPYIAFPYKAKKSGTFNFEWKDDNGNTYTMKRKMTVT